MNIFILLQYSFYCADAPQKTSMTLPLIKPDPCLKPVSEVSVVDHSTRAIMGTRDTASQGGDAILAALFTDKQSVTNSLYEISPWRVCRK